VSRGFFTGGIIPADIWNYPTRTLTQAKFPFWSAIITQTRGSVSISANTVTYVEIRPPTDETWYVTIGGGYALEPILGTIHVHYESWDGSTAVKHASASRQRVSDHGYAPYYVFMTFTAVLTNTLRGRIAFENASSYTLFGYYGYSGFKLSHPHWSPIRVHNPEPRPWKRPLSKPLPREIAPLMKYAYDILFIDTATGVEVYEPAIILEENTPLAKDPDTGQPVELLTVIVKASVLADLISKFKAGELDPVSTGYKKYLDKLAQEGIKLL
jgi:hypothetical protein